MQALWELINAGSLAQLKPLIEPYASGLLWDPVMVGFLAAPAGACSALLGILLLLLGRKKKPLIGYARPSSARDARERGVRRPGRDVIGAGISLRAADRLYSAQRLQGEPTMFGFKKIAMPTRGARRCPGATTPIRTAAEHFVNHHALKGPYPEGSAEGDVRPRLLLGRREERSGNWATASTSPRSAMPAG